MEDFGAFLKAGLVPFAVEIDARRIGAQMATAGTVGVHIGDDVEAGAGAKLAGDRIIHIEQAIDKAFHPPFSHGFARVLAGDDPDRLFVSIRRAHTDTVERLGHRRPLRLTGRTRGAPAYC